MAALETHRMRQVVEGLSTVSDKIRALDEAGFPRADIARYLRKRYQHVWNVLEAPRPHTSGRPADRKGDQSMPRAGCIKSKLQIGAGGRIVIPAEMRTAMGISDGDLLQARVVDGELRLMSRQAALNRARKLVRQHVPEGTSLVDQLIAERRVEALREEES